MPRTVPIAVGAGVLSALVFALFLTGSPLALLVSPFTMLPLLLVGLSSSLAVSGVAAGVGILVIGLIGGSIGWAALYAAAEAVPALGLSRLALRKRPDASGTPRHLGAGALFTAAVAYMAALFVGLYLTLLGREGGMLGAIQEKIGLSLAAMTQAGSNPEDVAAFAASAAYVVPGFGAAWWLIILLANLAIAQALLTRWGRNQRPPLGLARMELPRWLLALFALCLAVGLVADGDLEFLGWTLSMIFVVPFFFVGMVCIHLLCRNWMPGPFVLVGIYLVLILRGWPVLLAAVLGIADQWIKLRDRIGGARPV
ncbi:MAG: DUF2232 domain-containing protein [Alphaproteobacteria bacterium]